MEIKNDEVVIDDEIIKENDFTEDELNSDTTDWKAKAQELKGIAKRRATLLSKAKEKLAHRAEVNPKEPPPAKPQDKKQSSEFDYGQKAFLKASAINASEYDFVLEVMNATGKSLDDVLESKYFQAELKEKREAEASENAVPSGTKRTSNTQKDTVDYWIAKDALPEDFELRKKVVNEKIRRAKSENDFTKTPVGNNIIIK